MQGGGCWGAGDRCPGLRRRDTAERQHPLPTGLGLPGLVDGTDQCWAALWASQEGWALGLWGLTNML